jgi:subtilisin family serine protease/photosystem II stability/assembly factor-like uncharacterized protein
MMKKFTRYFTLTFLILIFSSSLYSQTVDKNAVDGEIYFRLKAGAALKAQGVNGVVAINQVAPLAKIKSMYQLTRVVRPFYKTTDPKLQRTYLLYFKDIDDVDSLIRTLEKDKNIVYAEKAPLYHIFYTPNDPKYASSVLNRWHLNVIQATKAWDLQKGSPKIKIAIVDNAMDVAHPDLKTKFVAKIDLANHDDDPTPPKKNMDWSHGTHVSGLAGAATDNGIGVASIGFNVSLMAVKIASDSSDGRSMSYGYQGIIWAADHGADVINMSWGGPTFFQTGQDVMNYAYNKGCVLVAAAGNDGNDSPSYPADYYHVISVASTNSDDVKSSFSQYGDAIDVCAPGGSNGSFGVYSTVDMNTFNYSYMQGTSMASPIVAGLTGLMLSEDTTLTPEKLTTILKATCDNIDAENPGYIGKLGAGRINAYKAVAAVKDSMTSHTVVADFKASITSVPEGDAVSFTDLSVGNPVSWKWTFEGGNPATSTEQNPSNIQYAKAGSYKVTLTVSDGTHSNTETKTHFILVYPLITGAWQPQATGFSQKSVGINYISIVNPEVVWANAYDGSGNGANLQEFTKTTDGGNTWKPGKYNGVPADYTVSCIMAIDTTHAWIAMYSNNSFAHGGIFATADGGKTWEHQSTALFNNANSFPDIVYFWNDKEGVCMGDPINNYFEIYTTTDGGQHWKQVPTSNIPVALTKEYGYVNLYDTYGDIIWFGTNKGRVFKSTDRGHHWTVATTGLSDFSSLGFHNDTIGIATHVTYSQSGTITGFKMVRTLDGGKTWKVVNPQGPVYKTDIAVVPNAPGLLVSTGISQDLAQSGSAYSLDEGDNWTMLDDSIQYTSVKFYNSATGWAGGFNASPTQRGIWKWMGIPTAVKEIPGKKAEFSAYPNPTSGIIHFYVPEAKKSFEISIYDVCGKQVRHFSAKIVDSSYRITLDLSNLKKGFYVAVLHGEGNPVKQKFVIR